MIDLSPTIPSGIQNLGFGWRPPTNRFPIDQQLYPPQQIDNGGMPNLYPTDPLPPVIHPQPGMPGGTPGPTTGGTGSDFIGDHPLPPMTGGTPPPTNPGSMFPPTSTPPPMINPIPGLTGGQPPLTIPGMPGTGGGTPTQSPIFLGPPIRPDNPQGFGWRRRG